MHAFCERCCFWSDQLAKSEHGMMFAICLNPNSGNYARFTNEAGSCLKFMAGEPIDSLDTRTETR